MAQEFVMSYLHKGVYYVVNFVIMLIHGKSVTGKQMSVEEIMQDVTSYLPFIEASGGGITVSGGEPLLQIPIFN